MKLTKKEIASFNARLKEMKAVEQATEIIIENEYNACLDDHKHLKYLLEMIYIKGASYEELIARAKVIKEDL